MSLYEVLTTMIGVPSSGLEGLILYMAAFMLAFMLLFEFMDVFYVLGRTLTGRR